MMRGKPVDFAPPPRGGFAFFGGKCMTFYKNQHSKDGLDRVGGQTRCFEAHIRLPVLVLYHLHATFSRELRRTFYAACGGRSSTAIHARAVGSSTKKLSGWIGKITRTSPSG